MAKNTQWVVGNHAVSAVLNSSPERALALYVVVNKNNSKQQEIVQLATKFGLASHSVDKKELTKLSKTDSHQGLALQVKTKKELGEQALKSSVAALQKPFFLILDQVQDPHNFGACLRTADAAGVDGVIVAKDNSAPITQVVQKVASGAAETMSVYRVTNLARCMVSLKEQGVWMIGTSDKASHSIYQQNLNGSLALVMGAEGSGLRALTEKHCDALVSLPMAGSIVSSLNVSVATGICLFEAVRQRQC